MLVSLPNSVQLFPIRLTYSQILIINCLLNLIYIDRQDLNENSFESTLRINFNIVLTVSSNTDIGAK